MQIYMFEQSLYSYLCWNQKITYYTQDFNVGYSREKVAKESMMDVRISIDSQTIASKAKKGLHMTVM